MDSLHQTLKQRMEHSAMQTLFPPENSEFDPSGSANDGLTPTAWIAIKQKLKDHLGAQEFQEWIEPISAQMISDFDMSLTLPDMHFYQAILDNYIDKFEICKTSLGLTVFFQFEIQDKQDNGQLQADVSEKNEDKKLGLFGNTKTPVGDSFAAASPAVSRALTYQSRLNTEYNFQTFVNGPSNQFAHASCLAVADNPGQTYNPLFLYGSTGLGKTHLLHAVGNKVLSKSGGTITYISSERFMNEMIYCLRFNKMWDFRRKYRSSDLLLVDDIQFISGKERTQEEFFHTFNALYESKKQIVVTSDIFPQDISDIEDRLRNRFQWGLIADIQPPDIEHRVAILLTKAEKQGVKLDPEVGQYIATHAKRNIRVLEGALRRVIAFATLQGRPIDIPLAAEILQSVLDEPKRQITVGLIQKIVAEHFKVKITDLKSKKRQRAFSNPRQIAMFLSRKKTNSSFPDIGSKFGGKDHTTVMHAVKKIESAIQQDLDLRTNIETLKRKIDQQI